MEEHTNFYDAASLKDGFSGNRKYLKGFLAKMELIFQLHPEHFQHDEDKVIYIITRLYGNAMNWAASLIENRDPCLRNYQSFISKIKAFYGNIDATFIANQKLRILKQKHLGEINNYIMEFNKYADDSSWNEPAKMDAFLAGLHDQIATRILEMFPGPQSLFALQTIASRIDSRLSTIRNSSELIIIIFKMTSRSITNQIQPILLSLFLEELMNPYHPKKKKEEEMKTFVYTVALQNIKF